MNNQNTRRGKTQEVVYKNSHSKFNLESHHVLFSKVRSRIKYGMTSLFYGKAKPGMTSLHDDNGCVENAQQHPLSIHLFNKKHAGMTALFNIPPYGPNGPLSPQGGQKHFGMTPFYNPLTCPAGILCPTAEESFPMRGKVAESRMRGNSVFSARAVPPQCLNTGYSRRMGFTLIELLVVVLIIGILAAVALPQYQKAVEKARATEGIEIMATLIKSIDLYVLEHGLPASGKVNFTGPGDSATTENVELNIDFPVMCEEKKDFSVCATKNFFFRAYCFPNQCEVDVSRDNWDQYEDDDNFAVLPGDESMGSVWATYRNGKWTRSCWSREDNSPWAAVCSSLKSQGWN